MQIFTSAVPRCSHSPPRLGGEVPKSGQEGLQGLQGLPRLGGEVSKSGQEGQQRLRGKGSPQWHIWNLGPPRRIRGIPVEPSLTKGKLNFQYLFLYRLSTVLPLQHITSVHSFSIIVFNTITTAVIILITRP